MAVPLATGYDRTTNEPIDKKYLAIGGVSYADVDTANTILVPTIRHIGQFVNINKELYWYKNGIADGDLIAFTIVNGGVTSLIKGVLVSDFPVNGNENNIYLALSTGFLYVWLDSDSAYHQVGGSNTVSWGTITGTLSTQTDLQAILDTKVDDNANAIITIIGDGSKIDVAYLPAFVDEILEGTYINPTTFNDLTSTPYVLATGKIYVDTTTNLTYRYSGSILVELSSTPTAATVPYNNVSSGLTATNVQDAIDELKTSVDDGITNGVGTEGIEVTKVGDELHIATKFTSTLDDGLATIAVGGKGVSTIGALKTESLNQLIEDILAPTLNPTLVSPDNTFSSVPANGTNLEVGITQTINFTAAFNRGQINPQYSASSPYRSGLPNNYNYTGTGLPSAVPSSALSNLQSYNAVISAGANTWTSYVSYDAGVQPKNNKGANYNTPLIAGNTGAKTITINGIYSVLFGKVSSGGAVAGANRPTINQTLINGFTGKQVVVSTGTITINFNSSSDDYIWFAIPATSTSKLVWFINALNSGNIGGSVSAGGNLFPNPVTMNINSPDGYWSGVSYKIYVANYQTAVNVNMELRNS